MCFSNPDGFFFKLGKKGSGSKFCSSKGFFETNRDSFFFVLSRWETSDVTLFKFFPLTHIRVMVKLSLSQP